MLNRIVKRKWGWYWTILDRKHFKVKLLIFKKNGACSLQYHNNRNELWLFLSGDGTFYRTTMTYGGIQENVGSPTNGDYIEVGKKVLHKFHAKKRTFVIEVQYGKSCTEEDIVRL